MQSTLVAPIYDDLESLNDKSSVCIENDETFLVKYDDDSNSSNDNNQIEEVTEINKDNKDKIYITDADEEIAEKKKKMLKDKKKIKEKKTENKDTTNENNEEKQEEGNEDEEEENKEEFVEIEEEKPYVEVERLTSYAEQFPIGETLTIFGKTLLFTLAPLLIIIIVAGIILAIYYGVKSSQEKFFDKISEAEARVSFIFPGVMSVVFAGLIPFFIITIAGKVKKEVWLLQFFAHIVFFLWSGMIQSIWLQANGYMNSNLTGVKKTVVSTVIDQSTYGIFYIGVTYGIFYQMKAFNFNIPKWYKQFNIVKFFLRDFLLSGASNLICWIPGMAVVYVLPSGIQYTMTVILQCFYSLMLNILSIMKDGGSSDVVENKGNGMEIEESEDDYGKIKHEK